MSADKRKQWLRAMAYIKDAAQFATEPQLRHEISGVTRTIRGARTRLRINHPTIQYMVRKGLARIEREPHGPNGIRRTHLVIDI